MAYTFKAPDPGVGNSEDFDFFDDPGGRDSPTNLGMSHNRVSNVKTNQSDRHDTDSMGKRDTNEKSTRSYSDSNSDSSDYSDDSYSSDSDSEVSSRKGSVRKIEAKIPQVTQAEKDHSDKEDRSSARESRPKTSHSKNRRSHSTRSCSSDNDSTDSYTTDSSTDSEYDSDVTDVSPLHTPHSPVNRKRGKPPKSPGHKEVTFRRPPSATDSAGSSRQPLTRGDSDDIDLRLLMQAVMEMENHHNPKLITPGQNSHNNTFNIHRHPTSVDRRNFSFSNDNVRTIDKENQRLMQQIMRQTAVSKKIKQARKVKNQQKLASTNKMSTSAINRNRDQARIERENFKLLQRLTMVKPTTKIARDTLIKDYEEQVLFGCSVAAAHPEPKKKKSPSPYTVSFNPSFSSGMRSDDMRNDLAGQSGKRVRPASAKVHGSRPLSAKVQAPRPISAKTHATRPWSASNAGKKRPQSAKLESLHHLTTEGHGSKPAWDDRFTHSP